VSKATAHSDAEQHNFRTRPAHPRSLRCITWCEITWWISWGGGVEPECAASFLGSAVGSYPLRSYLNNKNSSRATMGPISPESCLVWTRVPRNELKSCSLATLCTQGPAPRTTFRSAAQSQMGHSTIPAPAPPSPSISPLAPLSLGGAPAGNAMPRGEAPRGNGEPECVASCQRMQHTDAKKHNSRTCSGHLVRDVT